jgi:predicted nucleic acid-binding protein
VTIVVDANVAVAVLDSNDPFHAAALRRCLAEPDIAIVNVTHAEALIHPTRLGLYDAAAAELRHIGFVVVPLDDEVADRARVLRATHGSRDFPMVDAVVVALGIERGWIVVTCDAKWPSIPEATVEVLQPRVC